MRVLTVDTNQPPASPNTVSWNFQAGQRFEDT